jgi:16S rRNA G966 N2-methylase RsmD
MVRVSPQLSARKLAALVGVSPTTASKIRKELANKTVQSGRTDTETYDWTKHPYIKRNPGILEGLSATSLRAITSPGVLDKMMEMGSKSPRYAQRLLYKERLESNKKPDVTISEDDVEVFVGDIRSGLPQIKDCSVDVVFVDPPYDLRAVEELYSYISAVAGRILRDGGSLLVMCGGSHLDKSFITLGSDKSLRFNWDIAYVCRRRTPLVHTRKVATAVKHVLWYVKGSYDGPIVCDLIEAPADDGTDKTFHVWGQNTQSVKEILRRISREGDVVCDFMCGSGSTAVAALELGGRKVIACDVDAEAVKTTRKRVRELFGHSR